MAFKSKAQQAAIAIMMQQLRGVKSAVGRRRGYQNSWSSKIPLWGKMRKRQENANVRGERKILAEQRANYLKKKGLPSKEWSKP